MGNQNNNDSQEIFEWVEFRKKLRDAGWNEKEIDEEIQRIINGDDCEDDCGY